MVHHRAKKTTRATQATSWGVAKTMKPGQRGAIKLTRTYGGSLVCVRYRENPQGDERLTTVELVVERVPVQRRADEVVVFKIKGATYDAKTRMWKLPRREVLRMGLHQRIAVPIEQLP